MGLQSKRSILGADKCLRRSGEEHQLHEYQISEKNMGNKHQILFPPSQ